MTQEASGTQALKVGELARRTGKTTRTLHFYEELGLLLPDRRTKGGFRLYTEQAILRIRWIERLQELGFSLQEIATFLKDLQSQDSGPASMSRLREFYAAKVVETRAAIARLTALESDLRQSLMYLDGCRVCDPLTQRSVCPSCDETPHEGGAVPEMVAAVQEAL